MEYLNPLKYTIFFYVNSSFLIPKILFSMVTLKSGPLTFPKSSIYFEMFVLLSWTVYTFRFYPIHERDEKLGFFDSLDCSSKFFQIQ